VIIELWVFDMVFFSEGLGVGVVILVEGLSFCISGVDGNIELGGL